ncbi:hypothetical protein C7974DRAFT_349609 [Boeremia exigua]|uniref:uncharacterized protein n=1 Tax=Boeremia exigua TaxID=749465 RepID=UPI001E8D0BD6|nr:uncharacterized protein C7974DRAFT_349609 [Boeremia exigua]KAH6644646.1 hypothetical protein C7974DRAFT_349609 [Boeremia exigua]
MLDAPTHVALTPTRPRQPSVPSAPASQPPADPAFSLLLSLPRELRDRVYGFALSSPYPFWWPHHAPMEHRVAVALLRASKQLHAEAAPVLYTANKFLFTHPSDCNVFRVVASPHAKAMHSVYLRVREKDLRLWTAYLGSKSPDRSLRADLPALKHLCIFMRCGNPGTPRLLSTLGVVPAANAIVALPALPPAMAMHVQAVQNALGQQVQALQQQVQHLTHPAAAAGPPVIVPAAAHAGQHHPAPPAAADADPQHHVPPPPPPPPAIPFAAFAAAVPHHHPQPPAPAPHPAQPNHHILATFLRFERELGIESLCLSLRETLQDAPAHHTPTHPAAAGGHRERRREDREREHERDSKPRREPPDVKIVCIMRIPKHEVSRLVRMYPDELSVDRNGDARTRFRRLHGAEICVEISGFDGVQG